MLWPSSISVPHASASAVAQSRPLPLAIAFMRSWTWLGIVRTATHGAGERCQPPARDPPGELALSVTS